MRRDTSSTYTSRLYFLRRSSWSKATAGLYVGPTLRREWSCFDLFHVQLTSHKVFKAFLNNDYEGKPGAARISKHSYRIMKLFGHQGLVLTSKNWRKAVLPGTNIVLSIAVKGFAVDSFLQCNLCGSRLHKTSTFNTRFWSVSCPAN